MKMDSLHELYVEELKDLLSAEQQLSKALPKMAKAASNERLSTAFEEHHEETLEHISRLETILGELDELGRGKKCKGMEGLIEEGKELIQEKPEEDVLDAGLISKAQHIEHYEIAGYGTVRAYAELMGHSGHVELLARTLQEEKDADVRLTELAMQGGINLEANDGEEGEDGSEDDEESGSGSSRSSRSGGSRGGSKRSGSKSSGGSRGGSKSSGSRGSSSRGGSAATYRSTSGRSSR